MTVNCASEKEALGWEDSIMERQRRPASPSRPKTIGEIYPSWISFYRANRADKTIEDVERVWKNTLRDSFSKYIPFQITRQSIEDYKTSRISSGVKARTVNKELAYFSGMIRWAADNEMCSELSFRISGFSKKMSSPPKPRPLNQEQITKIYEAMEPEYRLVLLLMADAGLRRNEAMTLTRKDVELEHGCIFVVGKGSKERIVPITTDRLMAELLKKKDVSGWLTVNPETKRPYLTIRKALLRAAKKVGLEKHVYHHLLRHSFGTNATVSGLDLSALQSIMGHSSPTTTGMYQHLAGEYIRTQGRLLNGNVWRHGDMDGTPEDTKNTK